MISKHIFVHNIFKQAWALFILGWGISAFLGYSMSNPSF